MNCRSSCGKSENSANVKRLRNEMKHWNFEFGAMHGFPPIFFSRNDVSGKRFREAEGEASPQSPPAGALLLKKKNSSRMIKEDDASRLPWNALFFALIGSGIDEGIERT